MPTGQQNEGRGDAKDQQTTQRPARRDTGRIA